MKIEQLAIYVVLMLFASCGSISKSHYEKEKKESEKMVLSEMSGIGVVYGDARMSEGVSVMETEVYYSLPDSSGEQHIIKKVERRSEKESLTDAKIVARDSIVMVDVMTEEVSEESEIEDERKNIGYRTILFISCFMILAIAMARRHSKL